jgi:uncharacterized protein (TIGR02145 family)
MKQFKKNYIHVFLLVYFLSLSFVYAQTISDIDGNIYKTIKIGDQLWMAENLKTTQFSDGKIIPQVQNDEIWESLKTPGYSWFNNDITYKNTYGALYNSYAINTGKLCPEGWNVPSETEWTELITFLDSDGTAGSNLKVQGSEHWQLPEWATPKDSATNMTGFSALPAGTRDFQSSEAESMSFDGIGVHTIYGSSVGSGIYLNVNSDISRSWTTKNAGISIRCIKNK